MTTIKIDKAALLQTIIERLQKEVADIRIGFEEARRTSIESPGRMQSRYDTMGVEAAWVADGLAKNLQTKTEGLARLKALRLPASPARGCIGALVGIGPSDDNVDSMYFILPGAGGQTIDANDHHPVVRVVTPASPAGKSLITKEVGDEVTIGVDTAPKLISFIV